VKDRLLTQSLCERHYCCQKTLSLSPLWIQLQQFSQQSEKESALFHTQTHTLHTWTYISLFSRAPDLFGVNKHSLKQKCCTSPNHEDQKQTQDPPEQQQQQPQTPPSPCRLPEAAPVRVHTCFRGLHLIRAGSDKYGKRRGGGRAQVFLN